MTKLSDAKGSDWDKILPMMRNKIYHGPSLASVNAILEGANKAFPFSKAKAIHDIGCGTAAITSTLIDQFHNDLSKDTRLIASDFSPALVKHVAEMKEQKIAQHEPCWDQVEALECDAQQLTPFQDGEFTHVLGGYMYFMLPDPRKGLREAFRVLTTEDGGGVLALTSWKQSDWADIATLIKIANPDGKMMGMPEQWTSVEGVKGELADVGFRDVEVKELDVRMAVRDPEDVVRMVMAMPFVQLIAKDAREEEIERAKDAMRNRVRELCPSFPGEIAGTALLGVGRR